MSNIEDFPMKTKGRETPERILKAALKWDAEDVIVIANIGNSVGVAGSMDKTTEILGLIELAKHHLLVQAEEE